jgi:hypothetical protein
MKEINANFYEILNIFIDFLERDFTIGLREVMTKSLCINDTIMNILWKLFQSLIMLSQWLDELIGPVKGTVTLM